MEIILAYLKAFSKGYTYDGRRNLYFWFGVLWGLPVPVFSIGLDLGLDGHGAQSVWGALQAHPIHLFFLAHPLLFGLVFGAMGTLRAGLEAENAALVRRLTEQATTDPLTGLKNRRVVLEELQAAIHRASRGGPRAAVVLFDLNGFKMVNDQRGHTAGDEMLRKVASALHSVVRVGEVLGRYGGDEFLLVASGDLPDAQSVVQRAGQAILAASALTTSAGIARFPEDGTTPEELIRAADGALAIAKNRHYDTKGIPRRVS